MMASPIFASLAFGVRPAPLDWIFKQSMSPSTNTRVAQRDGTTEKRSPPTALTIREYTIYKVAANKTGGKRRNIAWTMKGPILPVEA
ncbi:hypothetical protein EKO04_008692 [Ascochyta lentis]|uniref:Uncharacterized protein n=1 Tax=Ascochyta lentis TaxID=205686 RepID=A0A8H7IXV7_9PLEO|nr:hypothetical protein EKO04_008692 [Ascochyta lentis]